MTLAPKAEEEKGEKRGQVQRMGQQQPDPQQPVDSYFINKNNFAYVPNLCRPVFLRVAELTKQDVLEGARLVTEVRAAGASPSLLLTGSAALSWGSSGQQSRHLSPSTLGPAMEMMEC